MICWHMKLSKSEVNYSRGMAHSHCGPIVHSDKYYCAHFISGGEGINKEGSCGVVEGKILPSYWCRRYKRHDPNPKE